jgi:predicted alpha/beta hydrolase family esterase
MWDMVTMAEMLAMLRITVIPEHENSHWVRVIESHLTRVAFVKVADWKVKVR